MRSGHARGPGAAVAGKRAGRQRQAPARRPPPTAGAAASRAPAARLAAADHPAGRAAVAVPAPLPFQRACGRASWQRGYTPAQRRRRPTLSLAATRAPPWCRRSLRRRSSRASHPAPRGYRPAVPSPRNLTHFAPPPPSRPALPSPSYPGDYGFDPLGLAEEGGLPRLAEAELVRQAARGCPPPLRSRPRGAAATSPLPSLPASLAPPAAPPRHLRCDPDPLPLGDAGRGRRDRG